MSKIIGYKWLTDEMKSAHGNEIWEMDIWKEWNGKLELCNSGFHACRTPLQSLKYIYGNRWFVVEADGEFLEEYNDKFCCSEMRIIYELPVKRILLKFAIACAKNSLFRFEQKYPDDNRPRNAIEVTIDILEERLKGSAAESAAESAAWSAGSAAESAARSAELAAESAARLAWSAWSAARSAWSAARSAGSAGSAAWSAAWSARSAELAAESAAESAAWSAARSVGSAGSAAWSAAWSARSAELAAEKKWQEKKLQRIIFEEVGI